VYVLQITLQREEHAAELAGQLAKTPVHRQISIVRRLTQFLSGVRSQEAAEAFDKVVVALIRSFELAALIEWSVILAPRQDAPQRTVRWLATHSNIAVAGPVLVNAECLSEPDLRQIAEVADAERLKCMLRRRGITPDFEAFILQRLNAAKLPA
jgi:uncharacterized protein (DUF2336 family)